MMYQHGQQLGLTSTQKFNLVAGVILPAIAITVEATTKLCAQMLVDPVPTSWHLLLVLLVPLAQLQVWFAIQRKDPTRLRLAGMANAAVIGISLFYSIVFLPLIPIAALTLLIVLGLLPLAPFFSLLTAIIMRIQLRRIAATAPQKPFPIRAGSFFVLLGLTLAVIGLVELPAILTRHGLQMATSGSPHSRTEGIRFLRDYGNRDYMLRSCYDQFGRSFDLIGFLLSQGTSVKATEAREIYYRVTGETFDMSPPPRTVNGRVIQQEDYEFDENADGTRTPGIAKGLYLSTSNLDGSVDADGGVGNLNWTIAFQNLSNSNREVRAEIQLPPGAVVSDVSHWFEGTLRETEFTDRSLMNMPGPRREDRSLRLLVTTTGRDRVMLQSSPVPAYNNAVKIRIGITVPLVLQTKDQARLILPYFVSRNFHILHHTRHWILIDSKHPLNSDFGLALHSVARSDTNGYQLWGQFSDADLMRPETALRLARTDSDHGIWSHNPFEVDGSIVTQSVEERTPAHLRRIVIVVDTSASMAEWQPQIKAALYTLASDVDVQLVLADAEWLHETDRENFVASGVNSASALLSSVPFEGGADNAPALIKAWDLATATPGNNAIVWIHSPQRTLLEPIDPLINKWAERFYGPSLYSVQTSVGSDAIAKRLDGINEVKSVIRLGTLRQDLEQLFGQLSGRLTSFEFVRSVKRPDSQPGLDGLETSDHLARLWANDEVARILNAKDDSLRTPAAMLALRYKLVTPASGAVIQEVPTQLNNSDLKSFDEPTFVAAAEPDFASLLLLACFFFGWIIFLKTRKASTGAYPI